MEKELAKKIGLAARAARLGLSLSQADAAERVGISTEFYARIERGGTLPSVPTLVKMSQGLRVSADVLIACSAAKGISEPRELKSTTEMSPEMRRLLRRLRRASPKTIRLLNLVAAALVNR